MVTILLAIVSALLLRQYCVLIMINVPVTASHSALCICVNEYMTRSAKRSLPNFDHS